LLIQQLLKMANDQQDWNAGQVVCNVQLQQDLALKQFEQIQQD